jgi:wobble nucleotide-excising tRNase
MIKKIIKIKGVGKFENYLPKSITKFTGILGKIVLIYGANGSGKSTFSAIIRSLKGDNLIVSKRRTFQTIISPEIEILSERTSQPFIYKDYKWSNYITDIEIFDSQFISDNVYTGSSVETEHKRKLFDLILGDHGVKLKQKIEKIKAEIKEEQAKFQQISTKILKLTNSPIDPLKFESLREIVDIDKRIEEKESEIRICKSQTEIQNSNNLKLIDYSKLTLDFEKLKKILEKTISSISVEYLQKFDEHKTNFPIGEQTEQWIKLGYENIKSETCPFCERKFDDKSTIIDSYSQYFNNEYVQLQNDCKDIQEFYNDYNFPLALNEIELIISTNIALVDFWKTHTKIDYFDEVLLQNKETLIEQFSNIIILIQNKTNDPLKKLDVTQLIEFKECLEGEIKLFDACNIIIKEYIQKINEIKKTPIKILATLEEEMKQFTIVKSRFSEEGVAIAKTISEISITVDRLNREKDKNQEELKNFTLTTLSSYKGVINSLLKKFATYMEIQEIKSSYVGSSTVPSVDYVLSVSGNKVKLTDDGINPCFKYVLSDGDKSALALAFFLATLLDKQCQIENKIVVFDDPVSSFDKSRQHETIKSLHWIAEKSKQLIVLTHNLSFAGELYYKYSNRSDIQTLQLFQANNQTHFEDFPIEIETLPDILKDLETITKYLKSGAKEDSDRMKIKRCLRPILEGYFKMKFYGILQENDWLGGFIRKVKESQSTDKLYRLQKYIEELESINDWTKEAHHGSISQTSIDDSELRVHTEMVIKLIENI